MQLETLEFFAENRVATITLNRPPFNPFNRQLYRELYELLDRIDEDDQIQAVIITGKGEKAFGAGADITEMMKLDPVEVARMGEDSRKATGRIERLSKPVIAAINGLALGGGSELALACDLRLCAEHAKFGLPEINLGIIPGGGGTQRLQRLIGQARAKELMFFGEIIPATKAYEYGLVNKVVPAAELMGCALEWAQKLADKPSVAMKMLKMSVNGGADSDLNTALELESACFGVAFASEDRKEGMAAFAEKRKPNFVGK
ncbi:enoyl-CoA hydratase/isomerase family protein [Brevibacillus ginsengisoli]|uniref:enoyl-CoA hydratase/isomerase family protein n=1 Tax=Brevibacillus ginsengisoli TaxID=363854 RepID=UPI003CEC75AB